MKYTLKLTEIALEDIERHKKTRDRTVLKKIEKLFNELMEHPKEGTGHPEVLKYDLKGLYSRRINKKHRLIYSIEESEVTVHVLNLWSHYGDK